MKKIPLLFFLAGLLVLTPGVLAIGISPVYREIYFEPNLNKTFHFLMIGDRDSDLLVRPYVDGFLANYTTVPDRSYLIPATKGVPFGAVLTLPETMPPGKHMLRVGILEELPSTSSGMQGIVAKLGVESLIALRVPYPAKYLELGMRCSETAAGENAKFDLDVYNRGTKDLQDVSGYVEVFSPEHKKMGRAYMKEGSLFIPTAGSGHFTAEMGTSGFQPGMYEAVATINYDGNQTSTRCGFRVGELNVEIKSFGANDTQQGGIAKFGALLQSTWNSEIPQVFNEVEIRTKDGELVGKASGETIRVGSWSEKQMTIYWDTGDNEIGDYVAKLTLEYEGRNSTKSAEFRIVGAFDGIINFLAANWFIIVIAALVVLIVYQAIKDNMPRKRKGEI